MIENVVDFRRSQTGIDRYGHCTGQRHGELCQQSLVAIGGENAYTIAFGHVVGDQCVSKGLRILVELRKGDSAWPVDRGYLVRVNLGRTLQKAQGSKWCVKAVLRCESHARDCNLDHSRARRNHKNRWT